MNYLFSRFGKRVVIGYGIVLAILIVLAISSVFKGEGPVAEEGRLPGVKVQSVSSLSEGGALSLVGTVSSVSEVKLESEVSGRITRVPVTLGQTVSAGTIIASVENGAEYASLLQAEGGYEAALAAAQKSDVSVVDAEASQKSAKQSAINTSKSTLASWTSVLYNTVDQLYTNPRAETPGVRISAGGRASYLNKQRVLMTDLREDWESDVSLLTQSNSSADVIKTLDEAIEKTNNLNFLVSELIEFIVRQEPNSVFTEAKLANLQTEFATAKTTLNSNVTALETAKTNLIRADEALASAQIGGTGAEVSSANAAVKQALGSLRAAQSAYNKTIIRTPIGGTVNSLSVKVGDYLSVRSFVANVANNNASIITTFIGDTDLERLTIGQEVLINGSAKGTVVAIAPGVDPSTKKAKVEIQSDAEGLINGSSVRLEVLSTQDEVVVDHTLPIVIPVSALKVGTDKIFVFTVGEDSRLVAHEVTEGTLQGTHIEIVSGLTHDMQIVTDVRGINEGDKVNVIE